jgi:hypothetical protein
MSQKTSCALHFQKGGVNTQYLKIIWRSESPNLNLFLESTTL